MDDDSGGVQPPRTLFSLGRPGSKKENGDGAVLADEVVSGCPACGAALVPGAAFCGECGAALTAAAPEADAATGAGADAAAAEVDDEGVEYEYEYVEEYEYEEVPEYGDAGVAGGVAAGVVGGAVAADAWAGGDVVGDVHQPPAEDQPQATLYADPEVVEPLPSDAPGSFGIASPVVGEAAGLSLDKPGDAAPAGAATDLPTVAAGGLSLDKASDAGAPPPADGSDGSGWGVAGAAAAGAVGGVAAGAAWGATDATTEVPAADALPADAWASQTAAPTWDATGAAAAGGVGAGAAAGAGGVGAAGAGAPPGGGGSKKGVVIAAVAAAVILIGAIGALAMGGGDGGETETANVDDEQVDTTDRSTTTTEDEATSTTEDTSTTETTEAPTTTATTAVSTTATTKAPTTTATTSRPVTTVTNTPTTNPPNTGGTVPAGQPNIQFELPPGPITFPSGGFATFFITNVGSAPGDVLLAGSQGQVDVTPSSVRLAPNQQVEVRVVSDNYEGPSQIIVSGSGFARFTIAVNVTTG